MRTLPALALGLALVASLPASAQPKLAPGLWETQMALKADGQDMGAQAAQMRAEMAKLPPDQRKMMEDMMAKQGMSLGGGGMSFRYCLSKEQAERMEPPADKDSQCKREGVQRSGNTLRFKFTCTKPPSSGSGEITVTSDKAYTMKMLATSQGGPAGMPRQMDMQQTAKWVGADCGALKPAN